MADKRKVEVFSAGCELCEDAVKLVNDLACESCEVQVHDARALDVIRRAKVLGVRSLPAVVVDGELAPCCAGQGVDEAGLRAAGVGQRL